MKRVVADAGTIVSWFDAGGAHRGLRREYEEGSVLIIGPRRLPADVLARLADGGVRSAEQLSRIAGELDRIGLRLQDPPTRELAGWLARGLDSERASCAALAEALEVPLVTDDPQLHDVAADLVRS